MRSVAPGPRASSRGASSHSSHSSIAASLRPRTSSSPSPSSSTSSSSKATPDNATSPPSSSYDASFVAAAASLPKDKRVRRPENVEGPFYVDSSCINCDVCRRMAPDTFTKVGAQSAVFAQPPPASLDDPATAAAAAALVSCPTASIHAEGFKPADVAAAAARYLPCDVPGVKGQSKGGPPVVYLGYTSGKSFGASSYLLLRGAENDDRSNKNNKSNIMVDSPRFDPRLASKVDELGGAKYIFLTHRDDVADHARWAKKLGAKRIMHELECNAEQGTDEVEIKLRGQGPWRLSEVVTVAEGDTNDDDKNAADDVLFVLQPGHTEACVVLLHEPSKTLFTGDVVSLGSDPLWSKERPRLYAYRNFCWYDFATLVDSVERGLKPLEFLHVVPGHGRSGSFGSLEEKDAAIDELVQREKAFDAAAAAAAAAAKN